jgi:hypothetical protein
MVIVLRIIALLMVAVAILLIYAVIHAVASTEGARAGVAVAYVVGAIVLTFGALRLWRIRPAGADAPPPPGDAPPPPA